MGDKEGYWTGKMPPHNVQPPWCEADYAVTPYIAEFWNTLTSVPLVAIGFYSRVPCSAAAIVSTISS